MIVPWFGDARRLIYAYPQKPNCSGKSSKTGFCITDHSKGLPKTWQTDNYVELKVGRLVESMSIAASILLLALFVAILFSHIAIPYLPTAQYLLPHSLRIPAVSLTALSVSILLLVSLWFLRQDKKLLQYHGVEHKVGCLIEAGLEPTYENLCRVPKNFYRCSFTDLSYTYTLYALVGISVLANWTVVLWLIAASRMYEAVVITLTKRLLPPGSPYRGKIQRCAVLPRNVLSAILILPALLQYLFAIREPSEEILQEGLELAQKIYREQHQKST